MTVNVNKPALNVREKLAELDKPTGIAGEAMLRAETPQEQFNLIGAGRRNLLINGDFQVNQRGTSVAASGTGYFYGAADRWASYAYSGASSATIAVVDSYEVLPDGSSITRYASVVSTNSRNFLQHRIENAGQFSNQTYTLSGWVKAPSGNTLVGTDLEYGVSINYGNGGSSAEAVVTDGSKTGIVLTTEWQKFTLTFTVPNLTSKTFGPNTTSYLYFFLTSDGVVGTLHFANLQLELGKVATPFEHRSYGEELALCQRYYQRWDGTGANQMVSTGVMYASTAAITFLDFKTTMRTGPTVFASSTPLEVVVGGTVLAGTGVSFANATPWGVEAQITVSGGTVGHGAVGRLESGGYLAVDAEL